MGRSWQLREQHAELIEQLTEELQDPRISTPMTPRRGPAGWATALLLAAVALLAAISGAVAWDGDLPTNLLAGGAGIATNEAEEVATQQMMRGMLEVAEEIRTGVKRPSLASAMAAPANLTAVNASSIQAKIFASALATWQLGVWNAPSNKGLRPKKMEFYDLAHYYQVPDNPIGTLVMFHGCFHDASANWPYDPEHCPECLGLPEEVAHTKQALKHGFAVLAVESRNRSRNSRCFSSAPDPLTSDQWTAPYAIQNFLYEQGLQNLPVYSLGISAGAAFAAKVLKNFFAENFGGIIKPKGIISEVNAPSNWQSWGLEGKDGKLKYPDFPPVAFIAMERDTETNHLIFDRIKDLTDRGIPADYLMVKSRPVDRLWFYNRSPVITAKQSAAIVDAMQKLGFIDAEGNLQDDPRIGVITTSSPLTRWNEKLVAKLPWLHMSPNKPPMLSVLSDRSTIFEEMNAAFAYHEGIADYLVPCLVWLRSGGKLRLKQLAEKLSSVKLRDITMRRVYWSPPPSAEKSPPPPPLPCPKPSPLQKPSPPSPLPRPMPMSRKAAL